MKQPTKQVPLDQSTFSHLSCLGINASAKILLFIIASFSFVREIQTLCYSSQCQTLTGLADSGKPVCSPGATCGTDSTGHQCVLEMFAKTLESGIQRYYSTCVDYACPSLTEIPIFSPSNQVRSIYSCTSCQDGSFPYNYMSMGLYNGGVEYVSRKCRPCPSSCLTCNSSTYCFTCKQYSGYHLDALNSCKLCNQIHSAYCLTCNSTHCKSCWNHYCLDFSNSSNCVFIGNHPLCVQCNGKVCSQCQDTYFPDPATFNTTCDSCSTFSYCLTCEVTRKQCLSCEVGYARDLTDPQNKCLTCSSIDQCDECDDGIKCTRCFAGYFPQPTTDLTTCSPCSSILNCEDCQSHQHFCIECKPGFVFNSSSINNHCVPCSSIDACTSCISGPSCTSCARNYIVNTISVLHTCESCPSRSYSLENTCMPCEGAVVSCVACYHTGLFVNCTKCEFAWVLDSGSSSCVSCRTIHLKCQLCHNLQTCITCQYPHLPGSQGKCDQCQPGFEYLDDMCVLTGCQSHVSNHTKCIACFTQHNFVFEPLKSKCLCQMGYEMVKTNRASFCASKCSDGITTLPDEQCDDRNSRLNDGCDIDCKIEPQFICTTTSPSQCTYITTKIEFQYNYALRIQGSNRAKLSFSLWPFHPVFSFVNWSKYLSLNLSSDIVKQQQILYIYIIENNQIYLQFDYQKDLENLVINATLSVDPTAHSVQSPSLSSISSSVSNNPYIISEPSSLSLQIRLNGANLALTYQDQIILKTYKASSIGFTIITVVILLFFIVASYFHKMIGLETVQILQNFYFLTIVVEQRHILLFKTLNVLKFTAFGGYSDYKPFFGNVQKEVESLTFQTVNKNFVFVGLLKYFLLNVNISLIFPILALVVFSLYMSRKIFIRSQYIKNRQQHQKDLYTVMKRSTQWVYDHCLFPCVSIFNMIVIFCTILLLQSGVNSTQKIINNMKSLESVEKISYIANLAAVLLTVSLFSYEILISYQQYRHSRLSKQQKSRVTASLIQRLEHDENNSDKQNYKPGYVWVYLSYYLLVNVILMASVFIEEVKAFGLDMIVAVDFAYLLLVRFWEPYHNIVGFHNKALKFNHLTTFIFALACDSIGRIQMPSIVSVILVFLSLLMLFGVFFMGVVRLYIEIKFRQKMKDDASILDKDGETKKKEKMTKRQGLLLNNKYTFENQLKQQGRWRQQLQLKIEQQEQIPAEIKKYFNREKHFRQVQQIYKNDLQNVFNGEENLPMKTVLYNEIKRKSIMTAPRNNKSKLIRDT